MAWWTRCYVSGIMRMTGQALVFNRYVVDTNIVVYTLKGVENVVEFMAKLEENDAEVYYSTIVEAELFSFHELAEEQKIKIRGILDFGEIIDVDSK